MFRRLLILLSLVVVAQALAVAVVALARLGLGVAEAAGAAVGLAAAAAVSAALARQLSRRVKELREAVERMAAGAERPHVFPTAGDELSQLGHAFNAMSERLSGHIAELEADRQQLRTILSGMVEGVVALGADQRVLFVNGRARELLELNGEPVGRPFWEVVRNRPLLDAVRRVREGPGPHREEMAWTGAATRSLTVHAARLPGAEFRGAVLVLHDTTELRRLERLRQELVANVSHELKTPLAVIQACVETLLDGAMDDQKHRTSFLEQIARQGERLHALILDLLSLARLESGQELFHFDAVALERLVRDCVQRNLPRAEARHQALVVVEGPEVAAWADEEAVEQVLENLLDNALKYTPEGGEVRVRW